MSQEAFDALMPNEFWREVVDRVAVEVPGTLLLAEAFWLLEGYFVRTLGMHRVYNSAFMNMLRDEENAKYRSYLKKTIEFDPDILKRYVNFMSNPDERTAIDQFGWGDKYFGVCTMLSTLPGLPMFGHGQIEGFTERYGMEFKQAKMDEHDNEGLIARHQHDIAPLLKNRQLFADSTHFVLYDFWTDHGTVDENVFAYSNRLHNQRALILYNNRYGNTRGTIHISAAYMDKGSGELRQRNLADGLAVPLEDSLILAYRDVASGLEYLRRATEVHQYGLNIELRGYQSVVLLHWRELRPTADQPWDTLCDDLSGRGVHSVDESLVRLHFGPIHEAIRQAISGVNVHRFAEIAGEPARSDPKPETAKPTASAAKVSAPAPVSIKAIAEEATIPASRSLEFDPRLRGFVDTAQRCSATILENIPSDLAEALPATELKREPLAAQNPTGSSEPLDAEATAEAAGTSESAPEESTPEIGTSNNPEQDFRLSCEKLATSAVHLPRLEQSFSPAWPAAVRYTLPSNEPGVAVEQTWGPVLAWIVLRSTPPDGIRAALFDKLHLLSALAETFSSMGIEGSKTWRAAAQVRILLMLSDTPSLYIGSKEFWQDPHVRWLAGVNEAAGTVYVNKEQFEELLCWVQIPALLEIAQQARPAKALKEIESSISNACHALKTAGYKLEEYLRILNSVPDEIPPSTTPPSKLESPETVTEPSQEPASVDEARTFQ
jgi:hypothetical protein